MPNSSEANESIYTIFAMKCNKKTKVINRIFNIEMIKIKIIISNLFTNNDRKQIPSDIFYCQVSFFFRINQVNKIQVSFIFENLLFYSSENVL